AGGYVALPQMAPMDSIEGRPEGAEAQPLPPISALDKIIVAFAGPLFSFLLAFVFAFIVWQIGRPISESETTTVVGVVLKGGPAEKAGIRPGDRLLEVDDKPVTKFGGSTGSSVIWRVVRSEGSTIPVKFERDGAVQTVQVEPIRQPTKPWQRKSLRQIQIEPAQTPIVAHVYTNSPAFLAGIRSMDEVIEVNGRRMFHYAQVAETTSESGFQKVELKVRRGDKEFIVSATPTKPTTPTESNPMLGIKWLDGGRMAIARPGPWEQVYSSMTAMVDTIDAVLSRKSNIGVQQLGGAVKILNTYYLLFQNEQGWRMALWFSVLMNVNLAILNLLPFPILDGGHIVLAMVEGLRKRPVSARLLQHLQSACALALIGFMLFLTFFDVQELGGGRGSRNRSTEPQFAPLATRASGHP
ncbi:MAG: PDZ domain-containing protein, partial [Verrucomicrobia bacterium]|nr:PDZ domain-containing protein [Verrucomicrobiota bacterium]